MDFQQTFATSDSANLKLFLIYSEEEDPCARKCGREFKPLCGSDGQTYNNECLLEVAKCSKNTDIQIIRRSPCDGKCF